MSLGFHRTTFPWGEGRGEEGQNHYLGLALVLVLLSLTHHQRRRSCQVPSNGSEIEGRHRRHEALQGATSPLLPLSFST